MKVTSCIVMMLSIYLLGEARADSQLTEELVVTGNRLQTEVMSPARQITSIKQEDIKLQLGASASLGELIATLTPGMGQPSQTFTNYSQSLRGRDLLVLIDGVPMNTNRGVSRDLFNVHPESIERLDIVRGGNAIYGSGATGGVIFITTRQATVGHRNETSVSLSVPAAEYDADGLSYRIQQGLFGTANSFDYAFNLVYESVGAKFDANGDRIAPEPSQGDMFDADVWNVSAKLGRNLDNNSRIQLTLSYLDAQQDTEYASDISVLTEPLRSVRARSLKGLQLDEQNAAENTFVSVDYTHESILNSEFHAQLFYRDYLTRFYPFDARRFTNWRHLVQTELEAEVSGGRLTFKTPFSNGESVETELQWGLDLLRDESQMPVLVYDGDVYDASNGLRFLQTDKKTFMPLITHDSQAAFAQLHHRFTPQWAFDGGIRYDQTKMSFSDFIPLPQTLENNPAVTRGGSLDYDAWLVNASLVYSPSGHHEWYLAFNQGFELPDVGLQVRNANASFDINSSDLEAIKTDNYELGWRGNWTVISASVAIYNSTSDQGRVQTENFGLTLARNEERINGIEVTFDASSEIWAGGATLTLTEGEEKAATATEYRDMHGFRIPPLKATAYLEHGVSSSWLNRVQVLYSGSEDYRINGVESFGRREVDSYTSLDWISRWQLQNSSVEIGIENLLNEDYFPVYGQLLRSSRNTSHIPARGRTLRVGYRLHW